MSRGAGGGQPRRGAKALAPFAHWTTPIGPPRRFATWFFIGSTAIADDVATDGGEITDHQWFSPSDALAARAAGEIELPPPTFVSLTWLDGASSAAAAVKAARSRPYVMFEPLLHPIDDGVVHLYAGDVAYDDIELLEADGPRHRLWTTSVDWRYETTYHRGSRADSDAARRMAGVSGRIGALALSSILRTG